MGEGMISNQRSNLTKSIYVSALFLSLFSLGCAEGPSSYMFDGGSGLTNEQQSTVELDTEVQYQKAVLLSSQVDSQVQQGVFDYAGLIDTGLLEDLKDKLYSTVEPITGKLLEIKEKINGFKAKLQAQIDLLDPSIIEEARLIDKLQSGLNKLDKANEKIDKVISKIVSKLDQLSAKLDKLIDKISSGNVLAIILKMKLRKIKNDHVGSLKDVLLSILLMRA